jgi:hypothetical protein
MRVASLAGLFSEMETRMLKTIMAAFGALSVAGAVLAAQAADVSDAGATFPTPIYAK